MSRKLKIKQIKALELLIKGDSCISIARQLKLRPETLSHWRKLPEFIQEYERLIEDVKFNIRNQLTLFSEDTIRATRSELYNKEGNPKRLQIMLNLLQSLKI